MMDDFIGYLVKQVTKSFNIVFDLMSDKPIIKFPNKKPRLTIMLDLETRRVK